MHLSSVNVTPHPETGTIVDSPLCVIGAPRSGTTWLQRMLITHPHVCGGQESNFFQHFGPILRTVHRERNTTGRPVGLLAYLTYDEIHLDILNLWRKLMRPTVQSHASPRLLLEKTPQHARYVPEIARLLPGARFIHLIRDSRAVVASTLAASKDWGSDWAPRNAWEAAISWSKHVGDARQAAKALPSNAYHELRYEDLTRDTLTALTQVVRFANLPCDDAALRHMIESNSLENQRSGRGAAIPLRGEFSGRADTEPTNFVRRGSTEGWKQDLSLKDRFVVWRYTRRLMKDCGYGSIRP